MEISSTDLNVEFQRAIKDWPFIPDVEQQFGLPTFLLFAVGSRETNLTNEVGDGGHGNGIWQLDNRSHTIPPGFNNDVELQAHTAALMLSQEIAHFNGNVKAALAAYNAGTSTVENNLAKGRDIDQGTAGNNYSADTYARMVWLQESEDLPMSAAEVAELKAEIADLKKFVHDIFSIRDDKKVPHQFSAYTLNQWANHGIPADILKEYGLE